MIPQQRNTNRNPTASSRLKMDDSKPISAVGPKYKGLSDVNILCASCTVFDMDKKAVKRVLLTHDSRNELFRCPICNKTYSEKMVRHVMKLDLQEYIYHDEYSNKDIQEVDKERERTEKWSIKPINSESPESKSKKKVARTIK